MKRVLLIISALIVITHPTLIVGQGSRTKIEKHDDQHSSPNPSEARVKALLSLVESKAASAAAEIRAALAENDWYIRGEAALLLARVEGKASAATLLPLLSDENWFVRDSALRGLAALADPGLAESIRPLLKSPDAHTRASAAAALGRMKDAASADALIALLGDDDEVRRSAAAALGRIKAAPAADALIRLLNDQSIPLKLTAAEALGLIGDKRAESVIQSEFDKAAPEDAWKLAADLYRLGNKDHLDTISAVLGSEDSTTRREALDLLAELADSRALPAILALKSRTTDQAGKIEIAAAFGGFNSSNAAAALVEMCTEGDPRVRVSAIRAIGSAKKRFADYDSSGPAISALVGVLKKEQSDEVLSALADVLPVLDRTRTADELLNSLGTDPKSDERVRKALALIQVTPEAVAERAKAGDTNERAHSLELLGRLGGRDSVLLIIETLKTEKSPLLRSKAADALGLLRDRRAVEPLVQASNASEPEVRAAAITALARVGDSAAGDTFFTAARDANPTVRDAALRALDTLGISIQRLTPDLASNNWQVRAAAATTLSRLGDPRAVPVLISALKDKEPRVRVECIRSLSSLGDKRAVDAFISALNDPNSEVRFNAAAALGDINDPRAVGPLSSLINDRDLRVSATAAEALARMQDPRAIRLMVDSLASADWKARARAAQVLSRIPERSFPAAAVDPLVKALRDPDLIVRYYTSEALVAASASAVPALVGLMRTGNANERDRASRVLVRIAPASTDSLIRLLEDKSASSETRIEAARVLSKMREPRAVEAMLPLLRDPRFFARQQAAQCLGQVGAPALKPLIEMARASLPATREAVFEAIGIALFVARNLPPDAAGSSVDHDRADRARALEVLVEGVSDGAATARSSAVRALGESGDEAGVQPLIQLLLDESSPVRSLAASSLSRLGKAAFPRLIGALDDSRPSVRILAAQALGEMRSSEAVPSLVRIVKTDRTAARADAIDALGKIGDPAALDAILAALSDGSVGVRRKSLASLSHFRDQRAIQALVSSLVDVDDECRQAAASGLGEIGNHHVIPLLERLADGDKNSDVRAAAVAAIERIRAQSPDNGSSAMTPRKSSQ